MKPMTIRRRRATYLASAVYFTNLMPWLLAQPRSRLPGVPDSVLNP